MKSARLLPKGEYHIICTCGNDQLNVIIDWFDARILATKCPKCQSIILIKGGLPNPEQYTGGSQ